MIKDVMLDIETLSTRNDALVLSIGAVKFDCIGKDGPWFGDQFFVVPSLIEQIMIGRHVDQKTQEFWQKQPLAASSHWNGPGVVPFKTYEALRDLSEFIKDAPRVWANGIVFDIGILTSLYQSQNMAVPWKYNAVRDARTFYDTNASRRTVDPGIPVEDFIAHHPLGDCKMQIIKLWEHGWDQ